MNLPGAFSMESANTWDACLRPGATEVYEVKNRRTYIFRGIITLYYYAIIC